MSDTIHHKARGTAGTGFGLGFGCIFGVLAAVTLLIVAFFVMAAKSCEAVSDQLEENAQREETRQQTREKHEETAAASEKAAHATYIVKYIELYEVSAKYTKSLLDGKVPGVLFKLRNEGERSLDKVEVTVYFKDANGKVIAEKAFTPVLVSDFNFTGDNKPLKPGYVWQMEKGKFFPAKSVPDEWVEGSIDIRITEIRFSK